MENIEIKAAAFDVDGTLLPRRYKEIPTSTIRALTKLKQDGILLILASGRPFYKLPRQLQKVKLFDYYICCAGASVMDGKRNILVEHKIPADTCNRMMEDIYEENGVICLHMPEEEYVVAKKKTVKKYGEYLMLTDYTDKFQVKEEQEPNNLTIYIPESDDMAIQRKYSDCTFYRVSDMNLYDVVKKGISKQAALERIEQYAGCSAKNVMFFGDDYNDCESISKCGLGIAMGNAEEDIKKLADYVTDTCDRNGIEKALIKFGFLEYE